MNINNMKLGNQFRTEDCDIKDNMVESLLDSGYTIRLLSEEIAGRTLYTINVYEEIPNCSASCEALSTLLMVEEGQDGVLNDIVEQLRICEYKCIGGPLENNIAFRALICIAEKEKARGKAKKKPHPIPFSDDV